MVVRHGCRCCEGGAVVRHCQAISCYQAESALSRRYAARSAHGGKRMGEIGTVALARRLLIRLWRCLETGRVPEGAITKQTGSGSTTQRLG